MSAPTALDVGISDLLDRLILLAPSAESEGAVTSIRRRLGEPIRVAIAGRVKAGKSTLLNALVGERLAATDAGECTKIVTWYRYGLAYGVTATFAGGMELPIPFHRERDRLVMETGGVDVERIERLDVTWPSERLERLTLIDTPGLAGHDETSAAKTSRVLGLDDESCEVDAIVYLMRHAHQLDARFLEAFTDRTLADPSPVNAIGVLSRADEIGGGRPDAMESAGAVARRYLDDPRLRQLCATVVPVAGLVAETGRTLLESEGQTLGAIAALPEPQRAAMALSVDRFTDPTRSPIDVATRRDLLLRLGLFGTRLGLDVMGRADATPSDLARRLVGASNIEQLAASIDDHFARRASLLKARSALINLKAVIDGLPDSTARAELRGDVERLESSAPELGELRLLHLVRSGTSELTEDRLDEVDRLIASGEPAVRVGLGGEASTEEVIATIVARVDRWRRDAAFPLASAARREVCELVANEYERLYTQLSEQ